MKQKLLILFLFISTLYSFSQFEIVINGNTISNGDTFTFNETGSNTDMEFYFQNLNTTSPINTHVEIESITNGTGDEITLCYRQCFFGGFDAGDVLPDTPEVIAAGQTSAPHGNHFAFRDDASITYPTDVPVTFVIKFYEVDDRNIEIGTPIRVNYVYDASSTANVDSSSLMKYKLYPSKIKSSFQLELNENAKLNFYSIIGNLVHSTNASNGNNKIDISHLSSQIYFVEIITETGLKATTKIIKL